MEKHYEQSKSEILCAAIEASQKASQILMGYLGNLKNVSEKFKAGLVTEADRESEKIIKACLSQRFPTIDFLGEESADPELISRNKRPMWIVDPLDGTTNFVHGFHIFCVSIGYWNGSEVTAGVVQAPALNELYFAEKGSGAWMNQTRLSASSTKELRQSLLATGFFGEDEPTLQEQLDIFGDLVRRTRGIRRPGAAAYDLALVARGVFDGFWERNLKPWDSAAGLLLVKEAGGDVRTYQGLDYHPFHNSLVSANAHLVSALLERIGPLISTSAD